MKKEVWHMPEWLSDAVFYQIYPQSFYDSNSDGIGDLQGIIKKLDYLSWLGINTLWINPCFESPFRDGGYDISDYYKIAERYGTNSDLEKLVDEAKDRGIRVCLDLVPGHTSIDHPWFKKSALHERNEYSERYIWTDEVWSTLQKIEYPFINGFGERNGKFLTNFFWSQPALNYGFASLDESHKWQLPTDHPHVLALHDEIMNIMKFWLDMGVSGFRVDMAFSLVKRDENWANTSKFWHKVRNMLENEYPEAALISEWSYPPAAVKAGFHVDFMLGFEWDTGYNELFRLEKGRVLHGNKFGHSFFDKTGKGDVTVFVDSFLKYFKEIANDGLLALPTGNHDSRRISIGRSDKEIELVFAFLMTMPAVPFVYYGDEIGMEYQTLPSKEGGYDRTGSRTPMQWDTSKNAGFSDADESALYLPVSKGEDAANVESQINQPDSLLNRVKKLIAIRKENNVLGTNGEFKIVFAEKEKYPFAYMRTGNGKKYIVALNPSGKTVDLEFNSKDDCDFKFLMKQGELKLDKTQDKCKITMSPISYGIIEIA